jgi:hypothetical protein
MHFGSAPETVAWNATRSTVCSPPVASALRFLNFTEVRTTRLAALDQYDELPTKAQRSALAAAFATTAAHPGHDLREQTEGGADGAALTLARAPGGRP